MTVGGDNGTLEAIVLAGGAGARFGGDKLTAPWRGGVLIDGALGAAFAAPVRSVTVVTGADANGGAAAAAVSRSARARLLGCADRIAPTTPRGWAPRCEPASPLCRRTQPARSSSWATCR